MNKTPDLITSRDNARLKHARAVRDGKEKDEVFIEGLRLAEEAAEILNITEAFYTEEFAASARGFALINKLHPIATAIVSQKLLETISDTKTPQGIVLLAQKPEAGQTILKNKITTVPSPLIVVLHKLNNPSNLGAILRTAEAAGAVGAILTKTSADVFSPKSLRGAMGAVFRLSFWTNADFREVQDFCRLNNIKTVCADVGAGQNHTEIDWCEPAALIIGSEAHGLTTEELELTDEQIKIPMKASVESLNAAVASGIILYEAARQRNFSY